MVWAVILVVGVFFELACVTSTGCSTEDGDPPPVSHGSAPVSNRPSCSFEVLDTLDKG